jgi:hypothetical protein
MIRGRVIFSTLIMLGSVMGLACAGNAATSVTKAGYVQKYLHEYRDIAKVIIRTTAPNEQRYQNEIEMFQHKVSKYTLAAKDIREARGNFNAYFEKAGGDAVLNAHFHYQDKIFSGFETGLRSIASTLQLMLNSSGGRDPDGFFDAQKDSEKNGHKLAKLVSDLPGLGAMTMGLVMGPAPVVEAGEIRFKIDYLDTRNYYIDLSKEEVVMLKEFIDEYYGNFDGFGNENRMNRLLHPIRDLRDLLVRRGFRARDENKKGRIYASLQEQYDANKV